MRSSAEKCTVMDPSPSGVDRLVLQEYLGLLRKLFKNDIIITTRLHVLSQDPMFAPKGKRYKYGVAIDCSKAFVDDDDLKKFQTFVRSTRMRLEIRGIPNHITDKNPSPSVMFSFFIDCDEIN